MKVSVERLPESLVRLEIAADEVEFEAALQKAARKVAREMTVPGFRRGKAPAALIEKMYGRALFLDEASRGLMDSLYREALQQEEIVPVGDPEADITSIDPLAFTVVVAVYPTVEIGNYSEIRVEPVDAAVDATRIDEIIEQVRLNQSPWVDPKKTRAAAEGDQVAVTIELQHEGEEFMAPSGETLFVLGESNLLDELKGVLVGLQSGETGTVEVFFAEDDSRLAPDDSRRGKQITYNVTLNSLKERELLSLDDDFAVTYGGSDSMADLRQRVSDNLHAEQTRDARQEVVAKIIEQIAEASTVEVPSAMVDDAVDERINRLRNQLAMSRSSLDAYLRQSGQDEAGFRVEMRDSVARDVRNSIILREVAKAEEIAVGDADIEAEVVEMTVGLEKAEETRSAYLNDPYLRSVLRNDLYDRRLTDRLIEIATEGRGAVLNAWTPPAVEAEAADESAEVAEVKSIKNDAVTTVESESIEVDTAEVVSEAPVDSGKEKIPDDENIVEMSGEPNCPDAYPIKGNLDSMRYHRPDDPSYGATVPEYCFANAEAAEEAGYSLVENAS